MRLYVMSESVQPDGTVRETRDRQLVLASAQPLSTVRQRVDALIPGLATLCAVPAPAHEGNLKALLVGDLADLIATGSAMDESSENQGVLTIKVCRIIEDVDNQPVCQLRYLLLAD